MKDKGSSWHDVVLPSLQAPTAAARRDARRALISSARSRARAEVRCLVPRALLPLACMLPTYSIRRNNTLAAAAEEK